MATNNSSITREMLELSDAIRPEIPDGSVIYRLVSKRKYFSLSQTQEQIYDEGDKKMKIIGTFKNRVTMELEMVTFIGGRLIITPKSNVDIYNYMELSHRNASNPRRDKSIPAIWERVDEAKEKKQRQSLQKKKMQVYAYLGNKPKEKVLKKFLNTNSMSAENVPLEDLIDMTSTFLEKNPSTVESFYEMIATKEENTSNTGLTEPLVGE